MRVIILFMQRRAVAQGIMHKLRDADGVLPIFEPNYTKGADAVVSQGANTALIEIAEMGRLDARYCLALCARLRREKPGCRLLILCPEQDEASVEATVRAKQNGDIDDFLFYDATVDYLASKLLLK